MPRQAVSGTENWRAAGNHANALEKLGFCAYLNRLLTQAKPLTVGPSELTCLEFGSSGCKHKTYWRRILIFPEIGGTLGVLTARGFRVENAESRNVLKPPFTLP